MRPQCWEVERAVEGDSPIAGNLAPPGLSILTHPNAEADPHLSQRLSSRKVGLHTEMGPRERKLLVFLSAETAGLGCQSSELVPDPTVLGCTVTVQSGSDPPTWRHD